MTCAVITILAAVAAHGQAKTSESHVFTASSGISIPYRISLPAGDVKDRPLLLFLHGAGERGSDNEAQLKHGGELLLGATELEYVIVLAPQCPQEGWWVETDHPTSLEDRAERTFPLNPLLTYPLRAVKELVDSLVSSGAADPHRLYCTGLSMGGMAALDMMLRWPDLFAAIEPICSAVNIRRLEQYEGHTAIRLFHGECDSTVPVHFSREAYDILKKKELDVEYIEYPETWHNSWDKAFAESDFLSWMLSREK